MQLTKSVSKLYINRNARIARHDAYKTGEKYAPQHAANLHHTELLSVKQKKTIFFSQKLFKKKKTENINLGWGQYNNSHIVLRHYYPV